MLHNNLPLHKVLINKTRKSLTSAIMPHQYAYLHHLGTTDAMILQLMDDCTNELDTASCIYIQLTCLDFSKAFDKLQPGIILQKWKA